MHRKLSAAIACAALALFAASTLAQQSQPARPQHQTRDSTTGMDMGDMHHDAQSNPDAARAANDAMAGDDMDMNPHMYMTALRPENAADEQRAREILETLRPAIAKYEDYHVALADGFHIFLPNIPQKHYHFTNYRYAYEASFAFNPAHPTSLLYKKVNGTYVLEGAMYTARRNATEGELNERVPLSVARWHKHVNFCLPPRGANLKDIDWKEFGPVGSIATQDACTEVHGRWIPQVFGWMVHVYPYETDPAKIWAH